MKFFKFFGTTMGRGILVGGLILGASAAGKAYYDQETEPIALKRGKALEETLQNLQEKIADYPSARQETDPERLAGAGWTPANASCGEAVKADPKEVAHPTWKALELDLSKPTIYQFRYREDDRGFELLARTDNDCDGIYQVHRIRGARTWSGGVDARTTVDNPKE